jgi:hypothetical protein
VKSRAANKICEGRIMDISLLSSLKPRCNGMIPALLSCQRGEAVANRPVSGPERALATRPPNADGNLWGPRRRRYSP